MSIPNIKLEPIVLLEEVKIKSVVEENAHKKWAQENIKNQPPINIAEDQKSAARMKIENMKQLKTNKTHIL